MNRNALVNLQTAFNNFRPLAGKWINEPKSIVLPSLTDGHFRPLAGKWINELFQDPVVNTPAGTFPSPYGEVD